MSTRPKRYFLAKVNIHSNIFSPNLNELIHIHLPNAIQTVKSIKRGKWNWSFTDIKRTKIKGEEVIYGHITKSRKEKPLVKREGKTVKIDFPEEFANNAFFLYHIETEYLMHTSTANISKQKFIEIFEMLINQDIHVGKIIINHIPESRTIRRELRAVEKAVSLTFNLIRPNPTNEDDYNLYNKLIYDANIKEAEIKMKNEDGFDLTKEDSDEFKKIIEDGISLVESGYGSIEFKGFNKKIIRNRKGKEKITKDFKKFSSNSDIKGISTKEKEVDLIAELTSFIIKLKK